MESTALEERKKVHIETKQGKQTARVKWLDEALRRLIDIVGAGAGLVMLAPFFALIAWALWKESGGSVFYRGRRVGKGGKEFGMLKFRTMRAVENGVNGNKVTAQDDPRITPTGRWLREYKLNELPQLWNVLVGEMSLVGPRPEDPEIVEGWTEEDREILLSVRPGVTSPATVIYRDEESLLSARTVMQDYLKEIMPTKLRLDKLYLRNRSITTDLDVIFWTAVTLLPNVRKASVPQGQLYWGPVSKITGRYLSWLVIDTAVAFIAVGMAGVAWRLSGPLDVGWDKSILYALAMAMGFGVTNWLLGMGRLEWSRAPAMNVFKLAFSAVVTTGTMLLVDSVRIGFVHLPEAMIIFAGVLAFIGFTAVRYRERLITRAGSQWLKVRGGMRGVGERVLKVGCGENGALAAWIFEHTAVGQAMNVVGIVDDDPRMHGLQIDGYDVLGPTSMIPELVEKHNIGLIMYTIDNIQPQQRERILSTCYKTGVKVVVLPDILEIMRQELRMSGSGNGHNGTKMEKVEVDQFLGEVQELMRSSQWEAAQERLRAFREKIQEKSE